MRGTDDAHVHLDFPVAANAAEFAVIQETQQLRLQVERHLADFVEEDRTAFRHLDQTGFAAALRAGECAGDVTEQLALGEAFGQCRAIQRQERCIAATAGGMACLRHQFLPRARFTDDQQRRIDHCNTNGARLQCPDRLRFTDDQVETASGILKCMYLPAQTARRMQGQHAADGMAEAGTDRLRYRRGVQQEGLAMQADFACRDTKAVVQQFALQTGFAEQLLQSLALQVAFAQFRLGSCGGIGNHDGSGGIDRHDRVRHDSHQGVEMKSPPRAGKHVDRYYILDASNLEEVLAQRRQHALVELRAIDEDVGRIDLDRNDVDVAASQDGKDFVRDADAVSKLDVYPHEREPGRAETTMMPTLPAGRDCHNMFRSVPRRRTAHSD